MSLDRFHPATQRWFSETLGTPTAVQQRGWAAVRGADLLVEGLRAPLGRSEDGRPLHRELR